MKTVLTGLALAVCAATTVAIAQEGPSRGPGAAMMRADTDGDGVITRAEYAAQVDQRFARMDANGNGTLDQGEGPRGGPGRPDRGRMAGGGTPPAVDTPALDGAPPPPPPRPMAEVGATREQFRAMAMGRFDRIDANHDGRIDAAEIAALPDRRGGRGGGSDLPPPPLPPAAK